MVQSFLHGSDDRDTKSWLLKRNSRKKGTGMRVNIDVREVEEGKGDIFSFIYGEHKTLDVYELLSCI